MKKILGFFLLVLVVLLIGNAPSAHAAGTRATAVSITCPADGTSITSISANATRESYILSNTSGATVRIGFNATGTADLTDSNSIKLLAGQVFSDAAPSIYIGRVVCMSDDATPDVIYVIETKRQ